MVINMLTLGFVELKGRTINRARTFLKRHLPA
jgi:hypothetical protein